MEIEEKESEIVQFILWLTGQMPATAGAGQAEARRWTPRSSIWVAKLFKRNLRVVNRQNAVHTCGYMLAVYDKKSLIESLEKRLSTST